MKRIADWLDNLMKWTAATALAAMMLLTCADVIMRAVGAPIRGAVELVGFLAVLTVAGALPHTHVMRSHAAVDMLVRRFSEKNRARVDAVMGFVSAALFAVIVWQMTAYGTTIRESGEVSMTLGFPTHLVVYGIAASFAVLCLVILTEALQAMGRAFNR